MKLNSKRTFIIGLAFFSICAFWQMYDNIVPLILKYRYGISDGISGPIMALDNVLALFMLPLFGTLSDKKGARMPFIFRLMTFAARPVHLCTADSMESACFSRTKCSRSVVYVP